MKYSNLVRATICDLSEPVFEELKQLLLGEFISFSIIDHKDVTRDILAEKLCDYFGTLEIKTGKTFHKHLESYLDDLDSIVGPHIAKLPQAKKGGRAPVVPRARKYYDKAMAIKGGKDLSLAPLTDYSRFMLCLYAAAVKNDGKPIYNFNYAADCLSPTDIVSALKNEEISVVFPPSKKRRFDTKDLYSDDVCTLILSILILCSIANGTERGDADHA